MEAIAEIETWVGEMGYRIDTQSSPEHTIVQLFDKGSQIGFIVLVPNILSLVRAGPTLIETNAHLIRSLEIKDDYQGKGFGQLLLMYGMCQLLDYQKSLNEPRNEPVEYWVLDDDSDRSSPGSGSNIYRNFGFENRDESGPERQLLISTFLANLPFLMENLFNKLKPLPKHLGVRTSKRKKMSSKRKKMSSKRKKMSSKRKKMSSGRKKRSSGRKKRSSGRKE